MSKLFLIRRGLRLEPANLESQEALERIPQRVTVEADVRQSRNVQHHKLYWTCLSRIAGWLDQNDVTAEVLHEATKINCGIVTLVKLADGRIERLPGSTAFRKMDQTSFAEFFERAVRFWYADLQIPPVLVADLLTPELTGAQAA
jgi:hypothetical protein